VVIKNKTMKLNYNKQKREDMKAAGAYDGRFKEKVIKDKKKETNKKAARKKFKL
jgi:hypothetical protein